MTAATAYPYTLNRINLQQQQQQQSSSSSCTPTSSSVYPPTTTSAQVVTTTSTQPRQQPVVATAYVAGCGGTTSAAPLVVASAYVPSSTNNMTATAPSSATAAPILATAYTPTNELDDGLPHPSAPPMNPSYDPNYATGSGATGNNSYNADRDEFWEYSVRTFPNRQSETHCNCCGNAQPGGTVCSHSEPQAPSVASSSYSTMNQINSHMASISLGTGAYPDGIDLMSFSSPAPPVPATLPSSTTSGTMKVYIPPGTRPGQKLKVRSPAGDEVVKSIPNVSEWSYEVDGRPFFRSEFSSSQTAAPSTSAAPAMSATSITVKVHIPYGMGPGQRIKVLSPTGSEIIKAIPNQSEWAYEIDGRPFFRMSFGDNASNDATNNNYSTTTSSATTSYRPPPHSTARREFHTRTLTRYNPPPMRVVRAVFSKKNDNVLHLASFLDAVDLINLAQTCRLFGSAAGAAATDTDGVSLIEHAAHHLIESAPAHEQNWVLWKGRTTWVEVYHELLKLRAPPSFSSILGSGISHVNNNKYHVYVSLREQYRQQQLQEAIQQAKRQANLLIRRKRSRSKSLSSSAVSCVAIGNHIMSHGVHFVQFTMTCVEKIAFGIIRPFDEYWIDENSDSCIDGFSPFESRSDMIDATSSRRKYWGESNVHCCLYKTFPGTCEWTDWETTHQTIADWCGIEHALEGNGEKHRYQLVCRSIVSFSCHVCAHTALHFDCASQLVCYLI